MFDRWYSGPMRKKLQRPFVHLMFGAGQTGKSTLLNMLLPQDALRIDLSDPAERNRYLLHSEEFIPICRALPANQRPHFVLVDEG